MKIYQLINAPEDFRFIINEDPQECISAGRHEFVGKPMKETLKEFRLKTNVVPRQDYDGWKYPLSDCYVIGKVAMFSPRASEKLRPLLEPNGEILPVILDGEKDAFFAFNVTAISDALDEENCDLIRFDSGKVMMIDRYSFSPDKLEGFPIFKIRQSIATILVTDEFKDLAESSELQGFTFREVWAS